MNSKMLFDCFERSPVISAVQDDLWEEALKSPSELVFYLKANLLTVKEKINMAHKLNKYVFINIDMAEGIGKDRFGVQILANLGADGIISTKTQLIKFAKEFNLLTVQRLFALDSQGVANMNAMIGMAKPDMIEIMPGTVYKIIKRMSNCGIPLIAGGLLETKNEVTEALSNGAVSVSTGNPELWYI